MMKNTKKNRVIIFMEGGCVQEAAADNPEVEIIIIDADLQEPEWRNAKRVDNILADFMELKPEAMSLNWERWINAPYLNKSFDILI